MIPIGRALLSLALCATVATPVAAHEGAEETTISAIERGETHDLVYLEGAALDQIDDEGFLFSDGTGAISIDVDEDTEAGLPPLFELISIEGTLAGDGIDLSHWEAVPIFTPAVIVEEPQVIDAVWNWIIAYDSQAPDEAVEPAE
jgi:hypothetical protein